MQEEYKDYNDCYEKFWKEIVEKDGIVNMDQVKRELSDYSFLLDQVPKVYSYITNGMISNPNTYSNQAIEIFEGCHLDKDCTIDDITEIFNECNTIEELKENIIDYLKI